MTPNLTTRAQNVLMSVFDWQDTGLEYGEGAYLFERDGKKYLDFTSGIAVNALGHNHPAYVAAAADQIAKVNHLSGSHLSEWKVRAAEILTSHSCMDKVFYCNSGTEATEAALKLSRKWAKENKGPDCIETICFENAFHGRTYGALSVTWTKAKHAPFEPVLPGARFATFNDLESVRALVSDKTAAIILEPIQGETGVVPAEKEFLQGLRTICDKHNTALIFDEIQCGMGRTGSLFAYTQFGVEPDIITLAKGLGNGFPIGAMLAREKFAAAFKPGDHGTTFGGGPLACRLACVVLDEILKPGFLENVTETGDYLLAELRKLDGVEEVRGKGLMIGIDVKKPRDEVLDECAKRGFLPWKSGTKTLRLLPPLIIGKAEAEAALQVLRDIL